MMINLAFISLGIGTFLLSSALFYLGWSKVRVSILRQSLFEIRDALWDEAHRLEGFGDEAYRQARRHLNSLIRLCGYYSLSMIANLEKAQNDLMAAGDIRKESPKLTSVNPELQKAIEKANSLAAKLIVEYVYFWRASGWIPLIKLTFRYFVSNQEAALATQQNAMQDKLSQPVIDEMSHLVGRGMMIGLGTRKGPSIPAEAF